MRGACAAGAHDRFNIHHTTAAIQSAARHSIAGRSSIAGISERSISVRPSSPKKTRPRPVWRS